MQRVRSDPFFHACAPINRIEMSESSTRITTVSSSSVMPGEAIRVLRTLPRPAELLVLGETFMELPFWEWKMNCIFFEKNQAFSAIKHNLF